MSEGNFKSYHFTHDKTFSFITSSRLSSSDAENTLNDFLYEMSSFVLIPPPFLFFLRKTCRICIQPLKKKSSWMGFNQSFSIICRTSRRVTLTLKECMAVWDVGTCNSAGMSAATKGESRVLQMTPSKQSLSFPVPVLPRTTDGD